MMSGDMMLLWDGTIRCCRSGARGGGGGRRAQVAPVWAPLTGPCVRAPRMVLSHLEVVEGIYDFDFLWRSDLSTLRCALPLRMFCNATMMSEEPLLAISSRVSRGPRHGPEAAER